MDKIVWTGPALREFKEIIDYIKLDATGPARALAEKVTTSVARLKSFPESGRIVPELDDLPFRELIVGPCRLIYEVQDTQVAILHVVRVERDLVRWISEVGSE